MADPIVQIKQSQVVSTNTDIPAIDVVILGRDTITNLIYEVATKETPMSNTFKLIGKGSLAAPTFLLNIAINAEHGILEATIANGVGLCIVMSISTSELIPMIAASILAYVISDFMLGLFDYSNNPENGFHCKVVDNLKSIFDSYIGAKNIAPIPVDPILIDLDGDGIETTTVENGTFFDHNTDGFSESSAWVGEDDGILAYDKNNNGKIDNGNEIFGDNYIKSDGTKATSGFDALSDLDSNNDGVIDAQDEKFTNIKIIKGDGTIISLEEAGISSISLSKTQINNVDANGNTQLSSGTYTRATTHHNNEVHIYHILAEYIWRNKKSFKDLYVDLKENLIA